MARALIVDFGGVLTTNIWEAFGSFCEREGLEQDTVLALFRENSEALAVLRGLETGELADEEFERRFGAMVGVADHTGLIGRMFADLRPEETMIAAVRNARAAGVRTGLITNSWGLGIYDRAPTDLFDERGDLGRGGPAQAATGDLHCSPASDSRSSPARRSSSTTCARTAREPRPSG